MRTRAQESLPKQRCAHRNARNARKIRLRLAPLDKLLVELHILLVVPVARQDGIAPLFVDPDDAVPRLALPCAGRSLGSKARHICAILQEQAWVRSCALDAFEQMGISSLGVSKRMGNWVLSSSYKLGEPKADTGDLYLKRFPVSCMPSMHCGCSCAQSRSESSAQKKEHSFSETRAAPPSGRPSKWTFRGRQRREGRFPLALRGMSR